MHICLSRHFISMVFGNKQDWMFNIYHLFGIVILNVNFVMIFKFIFLEEFQTSCISKGVDILHFISFIYFIYSTYLLQRVPSHGCSYFTWSKPKLYPRIRSVSATKSKVILEWALWKYNFCRSNVKYQQFHVFFHKQKIYLWTDWCHNQSKFKPNC